MSSQMGREFVVSVALQAVATVKVFARDRHELERKLKAELVRESGEWAVEKFEVREASVQVAAFADAFKIRKPRPTLVERRGTNDGLQIIGPIAAPLVS